MRKIVFILFTVKSLFSQQVGNGTGNHSIALSINGIVYAWGYNAGGQLGDNTQTDRSTPIQVLRGAYAGTTYLGDNSSNKITAVYSGGHNCIALDANGLVYVWGYGNKGQIGDGSWSWRFIPTLTIKGDYSGTTYLGDNSGNKIIDISQGYLFSGALAGDGTVYTWGYNQFGQVGDNTTSDKNIPKKVLKGEYSGTTYLGDDSGNEIIDIEMGSYHSIALAKDGTVYTWGYGNNGQLGNNSTTNTSTPIKVLKGDYSGSTYLGDDSNNKIVAITAGGAYSLALGADGTVYTWGNNSSGQLGDNTTTNSSLPKRVLKGEYSGTTYLGDNVNNKVTSIRGGAGFALAIVADGTVFSWGQNSFGQLGNGTTNQSNTPIKVLKGEYSGTTYLGDDSNNKITSIGGGGSSQLAMATDGSSYGWGYNNSGQLGDNSTSNRLTPTKISGVGGTGDLTMPVELTSFELLETRNDGITLQWVTESEINNLGFNLDRKTPITDWSQIASYVTHPALQGQGSVSHQTIYTYTDNTVLDNESYDYRLSDVDYDGNVEYHSLQLMGVSSSNMPEQFILYPNYPNPFNPVTTIRYDLSKESFVELTIYDMLGNVVHNLVNANESPGYKSIQWNATNNQGEPVSAGVYLYKIQAGDFVDTKKMILLK